MVCWPMGCGRKCLEYLYKCTVPSDRLKVSSSSLMAGRMAGAVFKTSIVSLDRLKVSAYSSVTGDVFRNCTSVQQSANLMG